jgi:hypothetical protein
VQDVRIVFKSSDPWRNVHTKFTGFPSSHSLVIKFVQTDINFEEVRLNLITFGEF